MGLRWLRSTRQRIRTATTPRQSCQEACRLISTLCVMDPLEASRSTLIPLSFGMDMPLLRFNGVHGTDTAIRYAIKGSPAGKLLLEDIYYAIESRVDHILYQTFAFV
jgi:hypothetical protein